MKSIIQRIESSTVLQLAIIALGMAVALHYMTDGPASTPEIYEQMGHEGRAMP